MSPSNRLNVERSAATAAVDADNPWPGLASFTEDARAFFFGREKETEELVRLVRRNTLTVLFGQSGLGKSSLLQAGAFPLLREADYLPLYLRLDHSVAVEGASCPLPGRGQDAPATSTLADQVKTALVAAFQSVGADAPAPRADESLWEYFHRKDIDIWSAKNRLLTPILAFDQFEEIFTLGRATEAQRERGRAFLAELADLVENRPPAALREKFDAGELDIARYNFDKPSCQVILSLREDFLPDLEGLKNEMRSIMHSRMRVRRLNGTQALEIVTRPAPQLLAEGVAERIVEFVAGARGGSAERLAELEVEPALLSVICRELNERRRSLGQTQISADLVSGNRREILTDFYERSVADLPETMRAFVEDHLLTKSGFRDNLALESALEFPGVTRPLIDTLVSRRLVRLEDRLGVQRVELTHDVLAEVIRGSRDTRHQRLATEQLHQRERVTRRRMWLARTIAAGLLIGLTGVSWIAWRAIRAEQEQTRLRAEAEAQRLAAHRLAYASDMNALQRALDQNNLGRARELLDRHRPQAGRPDLRGWEWRYFWQFCQSDAQVVLKPAGETETGVYSVAVSHDGKWAAAGDFAATYTTVINLQTKELIRVPLGSEPSYSYVAFSPREPLLAVGSVVARDSARLRLWDANTRQIVREMRLDGPPHGLAFSEDGRTLIVRTHSPGEISLWRVADGTKLTGWPARSGSNYTQFAATRDGATVAYGVGRRLVVSDARTGRERWSADAADFGGVISIAFSPDERVLASGAGFAEGTIRLWDAQTGRALGRLDGQRGWTSGLLFLPDGKHLLSSCIDQTIRLWNIETRTVERVFRGHKTEVWSLALLPDQRTLVSGCKDGSIYLWDLQAERAASASGEIPIGRNVIYGSIVRGGEAVVTVDTDGRVALRQGRMFQQEATLLEIGPITAAILDPGLPLLAAATGTGKLQVWDWERRVLMREMELGANPATTVTPVRFSRDGTRLLGQLARETRGIFSHREWEIATGRQIRSFDFDVPATHIDTVRSGYTVDQARVVRVPLRTRGDDAVDLDLQTGRTTPIKLDILEPSQFAYSPDGRFLVGTSRRGYARVFDPSTFKTAATLGGYMQGVNGVGFSPDGRRLATGGTANEALTLWDFESGERLLTVGVAGASTVSPMEFSPDGNLIVGGTSHRVLFWRAPTWAEIEQAEAAERAVAGR